MNGKFRLLLLMTCLLWAQLCRTQDHLKLKKLTADLVNAIAEANSGKKYGAEWVPSLGQALEEVHITSSRRCFLFDILAHKVQKLCPKPPQYYPPPSSNRPKPKPPPRPPPPPPPPPPATSTSELIVEDIDHSVLSCFYSKDLRITLLDNHNNSGLLRPGKLIKN
ncbi:WASH complex subunit 3 isoform X3 [Drosophila santomea]|uniref:WASH complex subunit 3 isoform X3 n=1 Tax=Drosophila santomea TaxID=129105 RepID=UPI0019535FE0|nr:WASH complex subunit 3 isoform X3 [Drosophila santomea]